MTDAPLLDLTWTDPVTGRHGYVVIDSLVRGLASGGLRVRDGCTSEEVRGLAHAMALKEAVVYDPADRYLPLGGAKGGLDAPPDATETRGILTRLLQAVRPLLREQWCTGEDLGVRQDELDRVAAEVGLPSTIEPLLTQLPDPDAARARLDRGMAQSVDGVALPDLVGGYGVAETAAAYGQHLGLDVTEVTAAVQGMGTIGGAAARYLTRAGVTVVAVSDYHGVVYNPAGVDVEALLAARDARGLIGRDALRATDRELPREAWLALPVDLLVPAAVSYTIGADDVPNIQARFVVEGANLPTLPEAESALADRDIPVFPDIIANVATNAWWWWVTFGDIDESAGAAFGKISRTVRRLVDTVAGDASSTGRTPRQAALALAHANRERLEDSP